MRLVGERKDSWGIESGRAEPGGMKHPPPHHHSLSLQLPRALEDSWEPPLSTLLALGCWTAREATGGLDLAGGRGQVRFHHPAS